MSAFNCQFDLFVIGAGSAGVRAARLAAENGYRVGIAEERDFGGTCVHRGCIPKKLYYYASEIVHIAKHKSNAYGFDLGNHYGFSWQKLQANKSRELQRLGTIYYDILKRSGVEVFKSRVVFTGRNSARIIAENKEIKAKKFLIATGNRPYRPNNDVYEQALTSDDIFKLSQLPKSIVVFGSGYIGLEFACILRALGSKVTIVTRSPNVLRSFDKDISSFFTEHLKKIDIPVLCNSSPLAIERKQDLWQLSIAISDLEKDDANKKTIKLSCQQMFVATGRIANVDALNLDTIGIKANTAIHVDKHWQTTTANIFAIGDVINQGQLTPIAIAQAKRFVAEHFPNLKTPAADKLSPLPEFPPTAIFGYPNIGSVGLSEHEAKARDIPIHCYKKKFRALKTTMIDSIQDVMLKIVVHADNKRLLGVHMVGEGSSEIVQCLAIAMAAGVTKDDLDQTLPVHPTIIEEIINME